MKVLAIDVSASSLRVLKITHDAQGFTHETIYRAPNDMEYFDGHYHWNNEKIVEGILQGIRKACQEDPAIVSIGVDTWGVDFVPLDRCGKPARMAYSYRDARCPEAMEAFLREHDYHDVYSQTGIQRTNFNTIFQLYDDRVLHPFAYDSFLLMPDYIVYRLTGRRITEATNISTGALYNPKAKDFSSLCFSYAGFDRSKMAPLAFPGETIGTLQLEGCPALPVIAVCSHDTASAVAAMPLTDASFYISSGTWALLGAELKEPLINETTYREDFTNEAGYDGRVCFLKNIMGFFMIQELRHEYGDIPFEDIQAASLASHADGYHLDVDDLPFGQPGDMKRKILDYLDKTGQKHGELSLGDLAHIVYESLAQKYAERIRTLATLTGVHPDRLIVTGGGIHIPSLLQRIADLSRLPVVTGEAEATAYGNAMVQMIANGEFADLQEAREALRQGGSSQTYLPQ